MALSLAEGLYLIALDDQEGRLLSAAEKTHIDGVIAASILELYLKKKISLSSGIITVTDTVGTGNGILDKILHKLVNGKTIVQTVEQLHGAFKDVKNDLDQLLIQRGILKREETKLLWIPLSERVENANDSFEQEIRKGMHRMVFEKVKPSVSFIILFSLVYDCGILDEVFHDKDQLIDAVKYAKDAVESTNLDTEIGYALKELKRFFGK